MAILIQKATQEDYESLRFDAIEKELAIYPDMNLTDNTCCFSGWCNDKLLAVAGFQEYWVGVFYCWICVGKFSLEHPIETVRAMNRMLNFVESEFEISRLQCTVRCDFAKARDLVEHLNFVCEGRMKKYTPDGKDAWLYAKCT